jgi:hypothetical protein
MARVNLRSISNPTTARQGSKEGKRFSFLGFFPFSKDTTRAIFHRFSLNSARVHKNQPSTMKYSTKRETTMMGNTKQKTLTSSKITKTEILKTIWKE